MLQTIGYSRYNADIALKEGPMEAIKDMALDVAGFPIITDIWDDVKMLNESYDPASEWSKIKTIRNLPIFGEAYYSRVGSGAKRVADTNKKNTPARIYNEWKKADTEEEKADVIEKYKQDGILDKDMSKKLNKMFQEDQLTKPEKKLKKYNNEERAAAIYKKWKKMPEDERSTYIQRLKDVNILTDGVRDRLNELYKLDK